VDEGGRAEDEDVPAAVVESCSSSPVRHPRRSFPPPGRFLRYRPIRRRFVGRRRGRVGEVGVRVVPEIVIRRAGGGRDGDVVSRARAAAAAASAAGGGRRHGYIGIDCYREGSGDPLLRSDRRGEVAFLDAVIVSSAE
jgi:hypothetical protein